MTLEIPTTGAVGARRDRRPAASDAVPLTRAELRRRAGRPSDAVAHDAEGGQASAAPAGDSVTENAAEGAAVLAVAAMGEVIAFAKAVDEAKAAAAAQVPTRRRRTRPAVADASAADALAPAVAAAAVSLPEAVVAEAAATALPTRRRTRSTRRVDADIPSVPQAPAFLDETIVLPAADSTHVGADASDAELIDEFEAAAKVFSFTGETPVQVARAAVEADERRQQTTRVRSAAAVRPRRGKVALKRMAAASFSVSVVGVVGLLAVGTTTPVLAVGAFGQEVRSDISLVAPGADADEPEIQAYVAASDVKSIDLERSDEYGIESMRDVAADAGVTQFAGTWVNDSTAAVQWPFPVGVPISAQFGSTSYLSKFSRAHHGTDFTPGAGAEIHAVAGGTVRIATEAGGDYGVTVVIDHIIDGELVSTRYGHMQYGSLRVSPGETVEAGQVIGQVGSTGKSTGAHLHLEVLLGGTTRIDPVPWLKEHTED